MRVCYNRNAGLPLDADLALLVLYAGISECEVAHTCVWREKRDFSDLCLKWSAKLLRLALDMEREVPQTRIEYGLTQACVWSLCASWIQGPRFSLNCKLRVEVRFASDDLSLVIFEQPTEPPPKFSIFSSWLGRILKYFGLQLNFGFPWLDWQSFEMSWAWSYLKCGLHECTVELLEASRKDCHKCFRKLSLALVMSFDLLGVLLNW